MENKSERFEMRLQQNLSDRLDNWRKNQDDLPSKSEAVRRLLETALHPDDRNITISDGEKLILVMISDIYRNLNIKNGEIDSDFILKVLLEGHHWALGSKYPGLFHIPVPKKQLVSEVADILTMWSLLEFSYESLSDDQKKEVKAELNLSEKGIQFLGFDCNNEIQHLGTAEFLINEMERFQRFKGRDLDSHSQTLINHIKMLAAYKPMREIPGFDGLSASQIITLMKLAPYVFK